MTPFNSKNNNNNPFKLKFLNFNEGICVNLVTLGDILRWLMLDTVNLECAISLVHLF